MRLGVAAQCRTEGTHKLIVSGPILLLSREVTTDTGKESWPFLRRESIRPDTSSTDSGSSVSTASGRCARDHHEETERSSGRRTVGPLHTLAGGTTGSIDLRSRRSHRMR